MSDMDKQKEDALKLADKWIKESENRYEFTDREEARNSYADGLVGGTKQGRLNMLEKVERWVNEDSNHHWILNQLESDLKKLRKSSEGAGNDR